MRVSCRSVWFASLNFVTCIFFLIDWLAVVRPHLDIFWSTHLLSLLLILISYCFYFLFSSSSLPLFNDYTHEWFGLWLHSHFHSRIDFMAKHLIFLWQTDRSSWINRLLFGFQLEKGHRKRASWTVWLHNCLPISHPFPLRSHLVRPHSYPTPFFLIHSAND